MLGKQEMPIVEFMLRLKALNIFCILELAVEGCSLTFILPKLCWLLLLLLMFSVNRQLRTDAQSRRRRAINIFFPLVLSCPGHSLRQHHSQENVAIAQSEVALPHPLLAMPLTKPKFEESNAICVKPRVWEPKRSKNRAV